MQSHMYLPYLMPKVPISHLKINYVIWTNNVFKILCICFRLFLMTVISPEQKVHQNQRFVAYHQECIEVFNECSISTTYCCLSQSWHVGHSMESALKVTPFWAFDKYLKNKSQFLFFKVVFYWYEEAGKTRDLKNCKLVLFFNWYFGPWSLKNYMGVPYFCLVPVDLILTKINKQPYFNILLR